MVVFTVALTAPRELEPAQGLRGEAGGRAHDDPVGPGRPLPLAGVDRDLRGERPGQEHVREGLQPGQLGLRGLLRAPQERVLPLQGLGGRDGRGVHGEARDLPRVLREERIKKSLGWLSPMEYRRKLGYA